MKDSVTRFNFEDAFKALDEIEIPVAEKGIKANRVDLKESMKRVDKFELLFEDFYDVNNADDMNAVSEEREAEVAKAKLARIEKIVDLDAETEDDILPSYVGKTIIQCPQCMTLFYKNAADVVRDEENPDVVNVNEVCQHCGNESGYEVVGKVAEETEATPGDELGADDFSAEVGDGENDVAIDDGTEATEEAPAEEGGEIDELSAEADLDSLDLDTELDLDEEPVEEEETNESLNTSELLKKIEDKNELKTEHESEKLTLNEAMSESAFDKVIAQISADIIAEVKPTPKIEIGDYYEEASFKDVFVSWEQWDEDNYTDDPAFSDAEKAIIDWIDNNAERYPGFKLNALNDLGYNDYFITINVYTDDVQESLTEDADLNKQLNLYNDFIKYLQNMVEQDEEALERAKKQGNKEVIAAIQKRLDNSKAELEAALPETVKDEAATEELPDATEAGIEDATDNTSDETEATNDVTEETTESLHEAVESMTDTLNRAWEVAKKTNSPIGVTVVTPVGAGTNSKIKEWSRSVNANLYYVDAKNPDLIANGFDEDIISRPDTIIVIDEFDRASADTQKAISTEIDNLDTQVEMVIVISHDSNINGDNFKRFKQYVATVEEKEETTESLTEDVSMTSSPENFKALLGTKEFKEPISQEEIESYFESVDNTDDNEKVEVEVTATIDGPELTQKDIDTLKDVEDIDDESFNECLTESLKEVYQNVNCFEMTNCTTNGTEIVVEGLIKFNSGKVRPTSYIFEARMLTNSKQLVLTGNNKDLFEQGNIKIMSKIVNETLQAKSLKYKYSIGNNLVEGLIK